MDKATGVQIFFGILLGLGLLVGLVRLIWMQETSPDKKPKPRGDSSLKADKSWNERIP